MTALEKKRLQAELLRITSAKFELELRIEERLEEIEKLKEHIKIQEDKEKEIQEKLK